MISFNLEASMKIVHPSLRQSFRPVNLCGVALMLLWLATGAAAQSTDMEFPTPVRSNEISGTISPRDVGDPRLTRYFYSLTGTNGDLNITVESRNLNGDVDLFTAGTLRPLVKLSMYAGGTASSSSKSIYFKREESLILRIEARSPNDDEGSFRIRFDGAFAPIVGEVREPEPIAAAPQPSATGRKTKRVTATGARIDEPVVETATTPTESSTTAPTAKPDAATNAANPESPQPATANIEPAPRPTGRGARARRPRTPRTSQRTARTRPAPKTPDREQPPTQPEAPAAATINTTSPATPEPSISGPRLIIETKDGLRFERYMTNVRRVTVENGQIVVVLKTGRVERQPLTNVLKMSIEP
jgi:hypothetical protein